METSTNGRTIRLQENLQGRILDVGGGGEGMIGRRYGSQVLAIDLRQEELDEAPDGFEKQVMDACDLAFEAEQFDHVTFFYSLMYMDVRTQKQALAEAARVLKPGGRLHLWDCDIPQAYPEPFVVDLEVILPTERIHTSYGIVSLLSNHTADSVRPFCTDCGLIPETETSGDGQFAMVFQKAKAQK